MAQAFRFRLQTLLRVRELRQREAQRRLAAKQAEIARLDRLEAHVADQVRAAQNALLATQRGHSVDPLELSRARAWIAHLRRQSAQHHLLRAKLAEQLAQLQHDVRQARTQTRALEKLRDHRLQQYSRQRARREQDASEEVARNLPTVHPAGHTALGEPDSDGLEPSAPPHAHQTPDQAPPAPAHDTGRRFGGREVTQ